MLRYAGPQPGCPPPFQGWGGDLLGGVAVGGCTCPPQTKGTTVRTNEITKVNIWLDHFGTQNFGSQTFPPPTLFKHSPPPPPPLPSSDPPQRVRQKIPRENPPKVVLSCQEEPCLPLNQYGGVAQGLLLRVPLWDTSPSISDPSPHFSSKACLQAMCYWVPPTLRNGLQGDAQTPRFLSFSRWRPSPIVLQVLCAVPPSRANGVGVAGDSRRLADPHGSRGRRADPQKQEHVSPSEHARSPASFAKRA